MTGYLLESVRRVETWGYTIYRTVYTPDSYERWSEALKRLDGLILSDFEHQNDGEDPGIRNTAREKYRNFIIEDKEKFDSATFESLEQHFDEWAPTNAQFGKEDAFSGTWRAFLVIDETALKAIMAVPATSVAELKALGQDPQNFSITAVEKRPEPDNYEYDSETGEEHWLDEEEAGYDVVPSARSWPGRFPVSLYKLHSFWRELTGFGNSMEKQWEIMQYNSNTVWLW